MEYLNLIKEALFETINKYCDSLFITIIIMLTFNLINMTNSLWFILIFSIYSFIKKIIQFIYNKYQNNKYNNETKQSQIQQKRQYILSWLHLLNDKQIKIIKFLYDTSHKNIIKTKITTQSKNINKKLRYILDIKYNIDLYKLICYNDNIYYINLKYGDFYVELFKIQQNENIIKLEFIDNDFINIIQNI